MIMLCLPHIYLFVLQRYASIYEVVYEAESLLYSSSFVIYYLKLIIKYQQISKFFSQDIIEHLDHEYNNGGCLKMQLHRGQDYSEEIDQYSKSKVFTPLFTWTFTNFLSTKNAIEM